jgi:hypothetical protein
MPPSHLHAQTLTLSASLPRRLTVRSDLEPYRRRV